MFRQKFQYKTLINLSPTLGDQLLTNSEMISGVTVLDQKLNHGVAISTMFNPDQHTFVELCKYPDGSGSMFRLAGPVASDGNRFQRIGSLLSHFIRRPLAHLKVILNKDLARHSLIFLIMQTLPYSLQMKWRKTL
ncbi:MAG: hypothetical protein IPM92_08000 [Saprospiraceae bacterium]|nr:hypothetical protein [Saprospiraceae bacterium]